MPADLDRNYRIDPADLPGEAIIFGSTPAMREIRSKIDCVLSSDLPVLIQGESGTGKEVVARFLHTRSNRHDAPFVKLNCAAIPASLLESELFGHERGSRDGAEGDRLGLIEMADGGTLFLDEIADMSWELQGKLLRFLQDGSFTRLGGSEERRGRIRVICASNTDLRKAVDSGALREDLFYRIEVVTLHLSALRDRKSDIPQLCGYLLRKLSRQFRRRIPQLNPVTPHLLKQWDWPGNLRELENWVARAVILGDDEALSAELQRQVKSAGKNDIRPADFLQSKDLSSQAASTAAASAILQVLQANNWDKRKTAKDLKVSYRALLDELRDIGVSRRPKGNRDFPYLQ
ncbi:MAG: sigma-54 dependent transcriptional regulator [Terracidiphilus sp.]|jgi:two-component system response regulator AtoC